MVPVFQYRMIELLVSVSHAYAPCFASMITSLKVERDKGWLETKNATCCPSERCVRYVSHRGQEYQSTPCLPPQSMPRRQSEILPNMDFKATLESQLVP